MDLLVGLFAILVGLAACFLGYRFFVILLPIWGFFAGLWLGVTGFQTLFGENFLASVSGLVIGVILGVVLALLSYLFYYIGVVILGASIGYGITTSFLVGAFNMDPGFLTWIIGLVVAVIFAILVIVLNAQKYLIVVITALGGASAIIAGLLLMFNQITLEEISNLVGVFAPVSFSEGWLWWLIWAALAIVGIISQVSVSRSYQFEQPPARRI